MSDPTLIPGTAYSPLSTTNSVSRACGLIRKEVKKEGYLTVKPTKLTIKTSPSIWDVFE